VSRSALFNCRPELGRRAEALVAAYLERMGFAILERNARLGHLELDLIARRGGLLVFCEVRARSNDRFISPAHTITPVKIQRLRQAAVLWLRQARLGHVEVRFDAACVVFDRPEGRLTYYEAAFR
jgi:putative endonuclease